MVSLRLWRVFLATASVDEDSARLILVAEGEDFQLDISEWSKVVSVSWKVAR